MVGALLPLVAYPGELRHAELLHRGGVYVIHIDADLAADGATVHAIVMDYERLERISKVLDEATVTSRQPLQVRLRAHTCILFYCFHVKAVGGVKEHDSELVTVTVIPGQSDFVYGELTWQLQARQAGGCSVHISGLVVPAFWIPPVIGPYILRRKLVREADAVIERLEELAAHE